MVAYLQMQMDASWSTLSATKREAVSDLFSRMVSLEQAFFDTAYAP